MTAEEDQREQKRVYNREWYQKNKERLRERNNKKCREWYHKNKEQQRARMRKWRRGHRRLARALCREWYQKNKEHDLSRKRKRYKKERDFVLKQNKIWARNHRENTRVISVKKRACKRNAPGSHTAAEIKFLRGITGGFCPGYKRSSHYVGFNKLTIDHIFPLVKGGSQFIENIQMLCGSCNASKGDKIPQHLLFLEKIYKKKVSVPGKPKTEF